MSTTTSAKRASKELGLNGIFELALGYQRAQVLFATNGLGVFAALSKGGKTAPALAAELGLETEALVPLLDASVAMNVLRRSGDEYANTRTAGLFLVPGRDASFHKVLEFWKKFTYGTWGRLEESIRTYATRGSEGRGSDLFDRLLADPGQFRIFFDGLAGLAFWPAKKISEQFDFSGCTHLLDIGGGAGAFSTAIAQSHPHLKVTLFDLEAVCALARERFEAAGLGDRARAVAGDFFNDPLPQADCALVANVLHDWSPEECRRLVGKIHDTLPPGGQIIIYEVMKPAGSSPIEVDLFALALHMDTQRGRVYDVEAMRPWLEEAGFKNIQSQPVTGGTGMVTAAR